MIEKNITKQSIIMATFEEKLIAMLNPVRFRQTTSNQHSFGYRHPFESDYFRVVTSAPVRRLQDKTQIFPLEKCDFYRRRLTHSLEVAAIGRRLGLIVEDKLIKKHLLGTEYKKKYLHSLATILETAGLVHDIGNPPFGHFGEITIGKYFENLLRSKKQRDVLNTASMTLNLNTDTHTHAVSISIPKLLDLLDFPTDEIANAFAKLSKQKAISQEQADFIHFDGNVHGFRVLRHLGLSEDDNSFNLTMPTLATIIKYPYSSIDGNKSKEEAQNHAQQKFGYYQSEVSTYEKICNELSMKPNQRHPLTYLLEAADDIANVTSDVEDGFKMGIISKEIIKQTMSNRHISAKLRLTTIDNFLDELKNQCTGTLIPPEKTDELRMKEFKIRVIHCLIDHVADKFIKYAQLFVDAAYNDETEINDVNKQLGNELLKNDLLCVTLTQLQKMTYADKHVLKSELLGEHVITSLLTLFVGCMFSSDIERNKNTGKLELNTKTRAGKLYALISDNYKRAAGCKANEVPEESYRRFLLAVDYVAGMTDSYAVDLYNELTNRKG